MHRRLSVTIALLVALILAAAGAWAQPSSPRQLGEARLPSSEALGRLGLKRAWTANVGTLGRRDGLFSVQVFDGQVVAQTFGGSFTALDAASGARQWQLRPGLPFPSQQQPAGANRFYCFLYDGVNLIGVDRRTGMREWKLELPLPLAIGPSADDLHLYLGTSDNKIRAYMLPLTRKLQGETDQAAFDTLLARRGLSSESFGASAPKEIWSFDVGSGLTQAPAAFGSHFVVGCDGGSVMCFENGRRYMVDRFHTRGGIRAPIAHYGDMAFIGSLDHHLYAVELVAGRLEPRWQFTAGSRIAQKPMVIGDDVFAVGLIDGMHRLDRSTGRLRWSQPRARRFLAATPRLVLAVDDLKQLLVLDRQRGAVLGVLDVSSFAHLPANDRSDRAFLAGNNGLVVCLRDADPSCDQPHDYAPKLSTAMETAIRDFRETRQAVEADKKQEKRKTEEKELKDDKP
jgi:outer membrane protein assembly factor BamB